ncbi:ATP synthase subunit I [Camelimonas fluminis]|nr:ATP synthase subunit I [Camelimonas fluminis]
MGKFWTQALRTEGGFSMSNDGPDRRNTHAGEQPAADSDLALRMKRLGAKLDAVHEVETRKAAADAAKQAASGPSPLGRAFRLSAEFIAGVAAGGLIGWSMDRFLGVSPWGLIVFLMLGFLTGVYNVMRATGQLQVPSDKKDGAGQ